MPPHRHNYLKRYSTRNRLLYCPHICPLFMSAATGDNSCYSIISPLIGNIADTALLRLAQWIVLSLAHTSLQTLVFSIHLLRLMIVSMLSSYSVPTARYASTLRLPSRVDEFGYICVLGFPRKIEFMELPRRSAYEHQMTVCKICFSEVI